LKKSIIFDISNHTFKLFFMQNFTLSFGKYKGQNFNSTPVSYQSWLMNQDWFKIPTQKITAIQEKNLDILYSLGFKLAFSKENYYNKIDFELCKETGVQKCYALVLSNGTVNGITLEEYLKFIDNKIN